MKTNTKNAALVEVLTSGEAARVLGVTSEGVRQMETTGRLVPILRSARGLRLYCKSAVLELAEARKAAKAGAR